MSQFMFIHIGPRQYVTSENPAPDMSAEGTAGESQLSSPQKPAWPSRDSIPATLSSGRKSSASGRKLTTVGRFSSAAALMSRG